MLEPFRWHLKKIEFSFHIQFGLEFFLAIGQNLPSLLNSYILLVMESEIILHCVRLCNEIVVDFNTFSLKYNFYRLFPSFLWPQIVKFKSIEKLHWDLLSF